METIIVKNLTDKDILLEDLGVMIKANYYRNIGDIFYLYQLKCSNDLRIEIENNNMIFNDGIKDLSKTQSLAFFGI